MRDAVGRFAVGNVASILFLVAGVCVLGGVAAYFMPSAVFPQTDFPRVVILAANGTQPADEMAATVTRPIEEVVKDIPGCTTVRSATSRGTAEVDVFFDWGTDMSRAELHVKARMADLQHDTAWTADTTVYRMTFSVFPIIGLSLTSPTRPIEDVWELARYDVKPELLRIRGIANVELVGGRPPEYRVQFDPAKLAAAHLTQSDVVEAIRANNQVVPAGFREEGHSLNLTTVDGRLRSVDDLAAVPVAVKSTTAIVRVADVATVTRGPATVFNRVTADGRDAVLLNLFSQPDASTLGIATDTEATLRRLRKRLPPDVTVASFYDQSTLVRDSARGVWEAIGFGLILSVVILYLFLKNWGTVLVATIVLPVSVLCTVAVMKAGNMSFNLMTLGGIAAAIGLVIDDAIVVVEAIYARVATELTRVEAVRAGLADVIEPLMGSTITPVVVFIPLAFLTGVPGVFFRALAMTMTAALLTSLVLAVTLTPALAARLVNPTSAAKFADPEDARVGGIVMRSVILVYERLIKAALRHRWFTAGLCLLILGASIVGYHKLRTDFLPPMDEGGFIIDYIAPAGVSLSELDRELREVEVILSDTPEVESFSRRTNAALGVQLVEPNTGDYLVKLKPNRGRTTQDVLADVRKRANEAQPRIKWEFPGILTDLIGDLTWEDQPIEIKVFTSDPAEKKKWTDRIEYDLKYVDGVVDGTSKLTFTGPTVTFHIRPVDAARYGVSTAEVGSAVATALNGRVVSGILEHDRVVDVRVVADPSAVSSTERLTQLQIHTRDGRRVSLSQVADVVRSPGDLELHRDDQREVARVTAELENRDLGGAMADVRKKLATEPELAGVHLEYGGLFEQQQAAFKNLVIVLGVAIALVFAVAVLEFRSFRAPIAIVSGAVLSAFGIVLAVAVTGTTLNVVTYLGALIGMGIVHKNGILVIDFVERLRANGVNLFDAVVTSGRRRLRPVLMTSLAAATGMLPLAYGIGSGTDLLRPLGVAVIGAVCGSVVLSLVATPTIYYLLAERDSPVRPE